MPWWRGPATVDSGVTSIDPPGEETSWVFYANDTIAEVDSQRSIFFTVTENCIMQGVAYLYGTPSADVFMDI